jgi:hypothetical protein
MHHLGSHQGCAANTDQLCTLYEWIRVWMTQTQRLEKVEKVEKVLSSPFCGAVELGTSIVIFDQSMQNGFHVSPGTVNVQLPVPSTFWSIP